MMLQTSYQSEVTLASTVLKGKAAAIGHCSAMRMQDYTQLIVVGRLALDQEDLEPRAQADGQTCGM